MPRSPTARSSRGRRSSRRRRGHARRAGCTSSGSSGPGGVHAHDRHLLALVELAARERRARGPDPCAARRPRHAAVVGAWRSWRSSRRDCGRSTRTPGSRASAGATGRWTATSAGSGSSAATTRSSTGRGSGRRRRSAAIDAAYARGETDEFVAPDRDRGRGRRDPRPRPDRPRQLPGRPRAAADARPGRRGASTASTGPSAEGRAVPADLLVVTMTEYEAACPVLVAFPPEEERSLAQAASRGRLDAVPRRRDREVRARHVLPQRRPRGAVPGRGAPADPVAAGRDLRPPARDERGRRHRRAGRGDRLGCATTSSSRTTRTRTWSATPGSGRPRSRRSRRSTPVSGGSSRRSTPSRPPTRTDPGALLVITADHGNADEMRDPSGCTRHRPLAQPGAGPRGRAGPSMGRRCTTASWPTSRPRSSSSPDCRAGPG